MLHAPTQLFTVCPLPLLEQCTVEGVYYNAAVLALRGVCWGAGVAPPPGADRQLQHRHRARAQVPVQEARAAAGSPYPYLLAGCHPAGTTLHPLSLTTLPCHANVTAAFAVTRIQQANQQRQFQQGKPTPLWSLMSDTFGSSC